MPAIDLNHLTKRYAKTPHGVFDCSLHIPDGDRLVLLGPSGSGKTTLLKLIAGLEAPDSGTITIGHQSMANVPPHKRGIAYVSQKPALYPDLTVEELIRKPDASARGIQNSPSPLAPLDKGAGNKTIDELFQLQPHFKKRPHELSGGEKQRVALARAFASGKPIWLLDEPLASLDPIFRAEFRAFLHLMAEASRATIVIVTHDPVDAWALGRRVGVLGDGRLQALGSAEELRRSPSNRFVAVCLGSLCLIDGLVSDERSGIAGRGESSDWKVFQSPDGSVTCPVQSSSPHLTLGLRPEDIMMVPPDAKPNAHSVLLQGWTGVSAEPIGSGWNLTLARGLSRVRVAWPSNTPLPIGHVADWTCPLERCVWFDATGHRIDD